MIQAANEPIDLPLVNRNCIVLLPKQAFLDWIKSYPDDDFDETLDELRSDANAYLIPECQDGPRAYLQRNYRTLLERELEAWYGDPECWPADRSYRTFEQFFELQYCSMVFDLVPDELDR